MLFSKVSGHPFAKHEGKNEKFPRNSAGNTFLDQHFNPLPLPGASELIYPNSVFLGSLSFISSWPQTWTRESKSLALALICTTDELCDLQQITKLSELHFFSLLDEDNKACVPEVQIKPSIQMHSTH